MKYKQESLVNVNKRVVCDVPDGSGTNIVFFDLRLCSELIFSLNIVKQSAIRCVTYPDIIVQAPVYAAEIFTFSSMAAPRSSGNVSRWEKHEQDFDAHLNIQLFKPSQHIVS